MKCLLNVCITLWLITKTTAEEIPKCHGVTDEQMAEIKKIVVTEDISEMLPGLYSAVFGPKLVLEEGDTVTCLNITNEKTDDGNIKFSVSRKGAWVGDKLNVEGILQKVENGIYTMKKPDGELDGAAYFFYAKDKVYAISMCWTNEPAPDTERAKLPFVTAIHTKERPMGEETIKHVEAAKKIIKEHPTLFGEIEYYNILC